MQWKDQLAQMRSELESLTQQLNASKAESTDLSDKLTAATQSLSSSETRCTELEAEVEEEHSARLRVESELDLLSQQPTRHSVAADSPSGSSARKAEAAQEELQKLRSARSAIQNTS